MICAPRVFFNKAQLSFCKSYIKDNKKPLNLYPVKFCKLVPWNLPLANIPQGAQYFTGERGFTSN